MSYPEEVHATYIHYYVYRYIVSCIGINLYLCNIVLRVTEKDYVLQEQCAVYLFGLVQ